MVTRVNDRSKRRPQKNAIAAVLSLSKNPSAYRFVAPIVALGFFLLIWQIFSASPQATLPGPLKVLTDTWDLIINPFFDSGEAADKGLGWQIWASLQRVAIGYSLAAIAGIAIGILIGTNQLIYWAVDPIFQVLRTVPPLAWLPISLAIFQNSNPAGIFVIFITAIWPIIFNTAVGVQQIPQDYKNVSKVLQLPKHDYFLQILIPATVPYVFTGLRIGIGLAWLAIVAAEMLRGDSGIGFFIWNSYQTLNNSEVILALVYIGVVGLILDKLVGFIATRLVPEEKK